jgi:4-amino-4-deoxy-L-arabinose transferase-like glycosyltransferase
MNPQRMKQGSSPQNRTDVLLLVACCGFLLFYGLGALGLVGADEPRYAQVAREMLERMDWVTPTLQGKAWLEKPPLYYWEAMLAFRIAGVSDWAARLPAAFDALLLTAGIYFFLRRFRPGYEFDGALITASCAGVVGFAHAAATDMPLTACFAIAMISWYAWYESRSRIYLAAFYFFLALGTLAKGPVAPALAAVIIFLFLALRRHWRVVLRTLWVPGIALYFVVALPWYIAVQLRNPEFFRVFILEHNLARFSTGVYHHPQPFWFYLPVFLLAMMPWTLVLIVAVVERFRLAWSEGKEAFSSLEDSWALFLLIWMVVPIVFFSASQSKLPGYIVPAVPAGALLVAESLAGRRVEGRVGEEGKFSPLFIAAHAALCGLLIFGSLSAAVFAAPTAMNHHLGWGAVRSGIGRWGSGAAGIGVGSSAAIAAFSAVAIGVALGSRSGARLFGRATLFAVVISVAALIRFAAPVIDATQSARPIAESIQSFSREAVSHEIVPVAVYHLSREQQYGLEFYLNRPVERYETETIPADAHVLAAAQTAHFEVAHWVPARRVSYLTSIPAQKVDLYWVGK